MPLSSVRRLYESDHICSEKCVCRILSYTTVLTVVTHFLLPARSLYCATLRLVFSIQETEVPQLLPWLKCAKCDGNIIPSLGSESIVAYCRSAQLLCRLTVVITDSEELPSELNRFKRMQKEHLKGLITSTWWFQLFNTSSFSTPTVLLLTVVWEGMSGVMGGYPPLVQPTVGEVWPRPQMVQVNSTYMIVRPETFK